jgi:hypothetical protein
MEEDNSTEEHSIKTDYLIKELHQLYSFIHTLFHNYIVWYTVFTTVNFAAIGWLLLKGVPQNIAYLCSIFMFSQNFLGIWGSIKVQAHMKSRSKKALSIGKRIDTQIGTLLSDGFYEKIFGLLIAGLVLWLIVWIIYPFILR